jgi:DNA-binding winged helix-turn-helix (wHTH) protein/tetratricopeptide (TPR) repeat protein
MGDRREAFFGDFSFDVESGLLSRDGVPVKIQPKPLALLAHLIANRDRVVSKEELLEQLWPGVTVSEQAMSSALRDLRRALDETAEQPRAIQTVRGRGFRFVAALELRAAGHPPEPVPGPFATAKARGDFVDRDEPLRTLLSSLHAAQQGATRVSFVVGPAGIGKTRLVTELCRRAAEVGFATQLSACCDGDGAPPFWPWLQLIRNILSASQGPSESAARLLSRPALAWLAPELASRETASPSVDLGQLDARFRLFEEICQFLHRRSLERPLLLVIEDLHWADEASLFLLEFAMQTLNLARVHVVGTFREDARLSRMCGIAARQQITETVYLKGLERRAVAHVFAVASGHSPSDRFLDAVITATSGNPLFVSELARLAGGGELDVTTAVDVPVPGRVRDLIRWQVHRLSPCCQRLLGAASVLGRELDLATLSQTLTRSQQELLEPLGEAQAAGLVRADPHSPSRLSFMHDLVRESVYRDLSGPERVRLHRLAGESLESQLHPGTVSRYSEIANHYCQAAADGAASKAVLFGRIAGDEANRRTAFEDAVLQYDRALSALTFVVNPPRDLACELLLSQADAAWGTQEPTEKVQERFVTAANAARACGSATLFARAALGRSGYRDALGDYRDISLVDDADVALLTEARAALGSEPTDLHALVLSRLALAIRLTRGHAAADALSLEALRIAERLDNAETRGEVLRSRHEVLWGPEYPQERVRIATQIVQIAQSISSRSLEVDAQFFLGRDYFELADFHAARVASKRAVVLAKTMRHPGAAFRTGMQKVSILTMLGLFDEAERCAWEFFHRDSSRHMAALGSLHLQLAALYRLRGEHQRALELYEAGTPHYPTNRWRDCATAHDLAMSGDRTAARRHLEALAADGFRSIPGDHSRVGCFVTLADTCWELGDARFASELYDLLLPYQGRMALPYFAICLGVSDRALGTLAALALDWETAEKHLAQALAIGELHASPPMLALTLERYGSVLLRGGSAQDRSRARTMLSRAAELATQLGMRSVLSNVTDSIPDSEPAPSSATAR